MFSVFNGNLTLFEGPDGYRPAEDSFWLSALLPPLAAKAKALDLGCGTGAVGLSYKWRYPQVQLYGVDHDPAMLSAAAKAATENNLAFHLKEADIQTLPAPEVGFDLCFANPPFYNPAREVSAATSARQNVRTTPHLSPWLDALLRHTKQAGYAALICLPQDASALVAQAEKAQSTCIRIFLLQTAAGKAPKRAVLIFKKSPAQPCKTKEVLTFDPECRRRVLVQGHSLYA